MTWTTLPSLQKKAGLSLTRIGVLAALYPAVWGLGQIITGPLSDRYGRNPFIVGGMLLQALALGLVAIGQSFAAWAVALVLLGAGTATVYPTLLAAIGDVAHPGWRARAVGVYRGYSVTAASPQAPSWRGLSPTSPEIAPPPGLSPH